MSPGDTRHLRSQQALSIEELDALLRDAAEPPPADDDRRGLDILLVGTNDDELGLLGGVLQLNGIQPSVARNPFTALDYLRARQYLAVFSDVSMWAARGSLLFERLAELDHPVAVISICDADPGSLEAARALPARVVLPRPLRTEAVQAVLDELCPHPRVADGGPTDSPPPPPATALDPDAEAAPSYESWYKFFFNVRRELRVTEDVEKRWNRLLELLLVARSGGAAALLAVSSDPHGKSSLRVLGVRAALCPDRGGTDGTERLRGRLRHGMARVREDLLRDGTVTPGGQNGVITIPFPLDSPRKILISVPPDVDPASGTDLDMPSVFYEELLLVVRDLEA